MTSEVDPKKSNLAVADDEERNSTKEDFIANLGEKSNDEVESVVPQTTLNRNDRSRPGAFRILTTRQAQAAANDDAGPENASSSSEGDDSPVVLDATIVASAVRENTAADPEQPRTVTEVFKAEPLEEAAKPQKFPRFVLLIVIGAFAVSTVSLGLAFTMRKQSSDMKTSSEQEKVSSLGDDKDKEATAPLRPYELFEPYNKITTHLAFVSTELPTSCKLDGKPIRVRVSCRNEKSDSVLKVYREFSLNVGECDYSGDHRTATCVIERERYDFAYIAFSCGFHQEDNASTTISLVEQNVMCSQSPSHEFDVLNAQSTAIRTAIALGELCWNFAQLEYRSVQTQCEDKESTFLMKRPSTDACVDVQMDKECTDPSGCMVGSYGIVDSDPVCNAIDWYSSVFGHDNVESATEYLELIAQSNRGFSDLFNEEVGKYR